LAGDWSNREVKRELLRTGPEAPDKPNNNFHQIQHFFGKKYGASPNGSFTGLQHSKAAPAQLWNDIIES
jgi:hypothetical protein